MKELKRQKHTVKLVYDKLIVDGHRTTPVMILIQETRTTHRTSI